MLPPVLCPTRPQISAKVTLPPFLGSQNCGNYGLLHWESSVRSIRRAEADRDASLAMQLSKAAEMLESAEQILGTLSGYRD